MATLLQGQWHAGETAMHHMLMVPHGQNPTAHGLPPSYGHRVMSSPLVAFGTLDRNGRPWTTVWGGEAGFARPIAEGVLGVRATVDATYDPVLQELFAVPVKGSEADSDGEGSDEERRQIVDGGVVRPEGGKIMAGLSIDLETRDRVKLAGRMVAGAANWTTPGVVDLQMAMSVEESLGNCPKYLNKKHILPRIPEARLENSANSSITYSTDNQGGSAAGQLGFETHDSGLPLQSAALALIEKSDLFFISSKHKNQSMDTNHRGGPPGFVRVARNSASDGVVIVYPEYSGNRLYQTLGNLQEDPLAGLVFPDFDTGDVLYLTGRTSILVGEKAAAYMPRTKLAVKITVDEARFVRAGLAFRGEFVDHSPYNPVVRRLATEQAPLGAEAGSAAAATAVLTEREFLTPTIARFKFKLRSADADRPGSTNKKRPIPAWQPGQHVTLDFAPELDVGWSHMRESDPQSLNDDFVRSFTVSAPLDADHIDDAGLIRPPAKAGAEPEMELTIRKHGPATGLLWRWNLKTPLEIPVLTFGGSEDFRIPVVAAADSDDQRQQSIFVAAGVGITPLLAQAKGVLGADPSGVKLLWSLKGEDLPLASDVFGRVPALGGNSVLFVTGDVDDKAKESIHELEALGATIELRRMAKEDVLAIGQASQRKYFCCTGPAMMKSLLDWTAAEKVAFEKFDY